MCHNNDVLITKDIRRKNLMSQNKGVMLIALLTKNMKELNTPILTTC